MEKNKNVSVFGYNGFIGKSVFDFLSLDFNLIKASGRGERLIGKKTEVVVNLIGKAHDHDNKFTEKDYEEANFELAKKVFDYFVNSNAYLLIHISTIAVVEEYNSDLQLNENSTCRPSSLYAKTKKKAEEWLLNQRLPNGKKLIILRPPMVHGKGDKGNLKVLYNFLSSRVPYPLASFNNYRSFISIENFCFFLKQIIINESKLETGIYNIADDDPVSVLEIIELMALKKGIKVKLLFIPKNIIRFLSRIGDILSLPLNSKRLNKLTGNLIVSNKLIKEKLEISKLPISTMEGLVKTVNSF